MKQHKYDGYEIGANGEEDPDTYTQQGMAAKKRADRDRQSLSYIASDGASACADTAGSAESGSLSVLSASDIELGSITAGGDRVNVRASADVATAGGTIDSLQAELNAVNALVAKIVAERIQPLQAKLDSMIRPDSVLPTAADSTVLQLQPNVLYSANGAVSAPSSSIPQRPPPPSRAASIAALQQSATPVSRSATTNRPPPPSRVPPTVIRQPSFF